MQISKIKVPGVQNPIDIKDTTYQFELNDNTLKVGTNGGTKTAVYTPDLDGYASRVYGATAGHLAGLNASGDITDSGVAAEELIKNAENITYAALKAKRDNSQLIPGRFYRITDYQCTTSQENTQSAGHQFDIVVLALDNHTLNENAYAMHHDGDTYFANNNLNAWKLKYKLTSMNDLEWGLHAKRITYSEDKYYRNPSKDFTFNGNTYYAWTGEVYTVYTESETPAVNDDMLYCWYFDHNDSSSDTTFNGNTMTYVDSNKETHTCTRNSNYDQLRDSDGDDYYAWVDNDDSNNVVFTNYDDNVSDGDEVMYCDSGKWQNNFHFDSSDSIEDIIPESTEEEIAAFKGVVYYMKDEFNNECPYDFKNIQFKRWNVTTDSISGRGLNGKYLIADLNDLPMMLSAGDENDYIWAYTFSTTVFGGEQSDCSISKDNKVYDNTILESKLSLNSIVLFGRGCYNNSFGYDCYNNSLGRGCYSNSFGYYCSNNALGNGCHSNSFENNYRNNSLGDGCYRNSFGYGCYNNVLGSFCYSNSFGNSCYNDSIYNNSYYNSFESNCYGNILEESCVYNTFDKECCDNNLGKNCQSNSLGTMCHSNSLRSSSVGNTFGSYCSNIITLSNCIKNTFGSSCQNIYFDKSYTRYIIIENGNSYITLTSNKTTSSSNYLQNIKIAQGVKGFNNTNRKIISHDTVNDTFQTVYQPANSQVISV